LDRKPIIGITPSPSSLERSHGAFHIYGIADTYTTAVEAAGGVPLVIPPQDGNAERIIDVLDGLLLSGGGDLDPARYGDGEVHPTTYGIHNGRDQLELALARLAFARDIPTLCICRGIQVLNVAFGGTLYQDVADQHSASIQHQQQQNGIVKHDPSHTVAVEPGSLLARVYGALEIEVNSFHHQGIRQLGEGLSAAGTAPDSLVEAIEHPGHRWMLGVQWHPEMMFREHVEHLRPFQALVEASVKASLATA
jgi:putative glutamine amidotransferase